MPPASLSPVVVDDTFSSSSSGKHFYGNQKQKKE